LICKLLLLYIYIIVIIIIYITIIYCYIINLVIIYILFYPLYYYKNIKKYKHIKIKHIDKSNKISIYIYIYIYIYIFIYLFIYLFILNVTVPFRIFASIRKILKVIHFDFCVIFHWFKSYQRKSSIP